VEATLADGRAGWFVDPLGRHQYRYFNGDYWTEHIADNGVAGVDPLKSLQTTAAWTSATRGTPNPGSASDLITVEVAGSHLRHRFWIMGAAAVIVVGVTTIFLVSKSPPNSTRETPSVVVNHVSLNSHDFPPSWTSNGEGGRCIARGPDSDPRASHCGNPPLPGSNQQSNDGDLAHCLGVPLSHVSMLTSNDEPGEPYTYSSSEFMAVSHATPNTLTANESPVAQSYVTLENSVASQRRDLEAFSKSSFSACMESWWKRNPDLGLIEGVASASGLKPMFTPVQVHRVAVPSTPGTRVEAYDFDFTLRSSAFDESIIDKTVIMGAGRIETVLNLTGSESQPFPASLANELIVHTEVGLAGVAAS
jgi:Protein of unknown function (DUF2510)